MSKFRALWQAEAVSVWRLIYSVAFSIMLMLARHVVYNGGDLTSTYVSDFSPVDILYFVLFLPIVYLVLTLLAVVVNKTAAGFFVASRAHTAPLFIVLTAFFMILWIPYLMTYWPGGIYSDTVDSIQTAMGNAEWDNHNPILYTFIWRLVFLVTGYFNGNGEYPGLKFFTVFQMLLIALIMAYFIARCVRRGVHRAFVALIIVYTALCPLYPFYGISLWKDTIFSIAMFIFSLFLFATVAGDEDMKTVDYVWYGLLLLLVIFLRNNGIYIAAFTALITFLILRNQLRAKARRLGIISLAVIIISFIIQGPVYDSLGFNSIKKGESLGIPIQQTAYIIASGGVIEDEAYEVLDEIMPMYNWITLYDPVVADTIKFDPSFNRTYFNMRTGDFIKAYLTLIKDNPIPALKGYMLATMGFWDATKSSSIAYICNTHFGNATFFMTDYFEYYLGWSFKKLVEPKHYLSSGLMVWFMLLTLVAALSKRRYRLVIPILPTIGLWLTLMIATPVSFSFRYVYSLFLCIPLYILIILSSRVFPAGKVAGDAESTVRDTLAEKAEAVTEEDK